MDSRSVSSRCCRPRRWQMTSNGPAYTRRLRHSLRVIPHVLSVCELRGLSSRGLGGISRLRRRSARWLQLSMVYFTIALPTEWPARIATFLSRLARGEVYRNNNLSSGPPLRAAHGGRERVPGV